MSGMAEVSFSRLSRLFRYGGARARESGLSKIWRLVTKPFLSDKMWHTFYFAGILSTMGEAQDSKHDLYLYFCSVAFKVLIDWS